jgi:hypothetical protein
MKTTAVVTKNPTKETHNGLVALFAGIVVITIGVGLTLLFFTVSSATTRLYYADLIAAEQLVLQANLTVLLYEAPITLADTVILQGIIVEEQALVRQISDLIDETNCRGVETINNVTADFGNGRNFNLTGDGGINVESDGVDTLYVNATALQTQYNSEQTAITTLFDMILAAQMAIDILDGEVVKSVNHVLPDTTEHNVNFTGMCRTSVYGQALAQVNFDVVFTFMGMGAFCAHSHLFSLLPRFVHSSLTLVVNETGRRRLLRFNRICPANLCQRFVRFYSN